MFLLFRSVLSFWLFGIGEVFCFELVVVMAVILCVWCVRLVVPIFIGVVFWFALLLPLKYVFLIFMVLFVDVQVWHGPFRAVSLSGCVPCGLCPFRAVSLSGCVPFGLCPFRAVSLSGCVPCGLCPLRAGSWVGPRVVLWTAGSLMIGAALL